ncbi:MAG: hypothetical protein AB8B71_08200 [Paracoccaceae bacterium]
MAHQAEHRTTQDGPRQTNAPPLQTMAQQKGVRTSQQQSRLQSLQSLADSSATTQRAQYLQEGADARPHVPKTNVDAIQMKPYTVSRNLTLEKGIKSFESSEEKKDKKGKVTSKAQSAKTRAMGEFLSALRSEYPLPKDAESLDYDTQENARGPDYLLRKGLVEQEFDSVDDDAEQVDVYRPSIRANVPDANRSGGTQAGPISKLTGATYIGAHLVKREWGGEDNMWNVVAWPKASAEDKWAASFEDPVDKAGLWGLDPGTVSISVTKEDDVIPKMRLDRLIEGAIFRALKAEKLKDPSAAVNRTLVPHFMDPVNTERQKINRAVESVPVNASGTCRAPDIKTGAVQEKTTNLDSSETKYDLAKEKALDAIKARLDKEAVKTVDTDDALDKQKIKKVGQIREGMRKKGKDPSLVPEPTPPMRLRDADKREKGVRGEERDKDWRQEREAYGEGFEFHNDLT